METLQKWLAVSAGGKTVCLVPVGSDSNGPDVFCKVQDVAELALKADAEREPAFSGPKKWTAEEIADGYRGIRWIMKDGVYGRPTESDLRDWLAANPMCKDPVSADAELDAPPKDAMLMWAEEEDAARGQP